MSNIEIRELTVADFELREESDGKRLLRGIAAPWNEVISIGDYKESFERGAFGEFASTPLFYGHAHDSVPVGVVTRGDDTDKGYEIEAQLLDTPRGNEVYEACKSGALKAFSVGFSPVEHRSEKNVTVRTKVKLREVSVVPFPAYAGSQFSEVRSDVQNNERSDMSDFATDADLTEVRNSVEDLTRKVSTIETRGSGSATASSKFISMGAFVKGLADGTAKREDAQILVRAFTGATTTDANVQVPFVNKAIQLIAQNRNVLELFAKVPLPATGNSFEYPTLSSKSGSVAVQAAEGDDLTYNEVILTDAAVPVKTYGGYSSLSRQAIERSTVAYLEVVLRNLQLEYAKATNSAVRAALVAGTYSNTHTIAFADKGKGAAWTDTVIDANDQIVADTGLNADVWIVPSAYFRALAGIVDTTGRPVFVVNGDGSNTFGNVDIRGLNANVAGVRVVSDPSLTGDASYIVSREALIVAEDASKFLQDENIINLTKDFSIYGYLAVAIANSLAVTKVTHATS